MWRGFSWPARCASPLLKPLSLPCLMNNPAECGFVECDAVNRERNETLRIFQNGVPETNVPLVDLIQLNIMLNIWMDDGVM